MRIHFVIANESAERRHEANEAAHYRANARGIVQAKKISTDA